MDPVLEHLAHHGIKGQKWGVRRTAKERGHAPSEDHKKTAALKKKPTHALSNQELKTANERLNLEQNFNRMNPSKKELGRKRTKAILANVGITSAAGFAKSPTGQKLIAAAIPFILGASIKKGISTIGRTRGVSTIDMLKNR